MTSRARRYSRMRLALIVVASITFIAALYFARAFFVPLLIGMLLSYTLRPIVDWFERLRFPRPAAAALVMLALVAAASWTVYSLSDEATALAQKLPEAAHKLRKVLSSPHSTVPGALQSVQEAANEIQRAAGDVTQKPGARKAAEPAPVASPWLRDYALAQSALLLSVLAQTPIVLLLAYFLLASGDHFRRKLVQFAGPSLSRRKDTLRMLEEIDAQLHGYLFVMLASNTLVALCIWLGFSAMGIEQAAVWGIVVGVLHFIPYLGAILAVFAAGIAAFLQFGTLLGALAVASVTLLVTGLIGVLFMTWLQSRFTRVNAAVLFIALLFFGWLWGIAGLLLGAPLLAIAKVICDHVESLRPVGELLGR